MAMRKGQNDVLWALGESFFFFFVFFDTNQPAHVVKDYINKAKTNVFYPF